MDRMCQLLVDALTPGMEWRSDPRVHPYTLDGRQIDVLGRDEWIEVWECGLAHPEVFARAGLDGWHGLALGLGLDRFLMLRMGIPDIRLLRASDPGVADQMLDLDPCRPVSNMPAIARDLSVAVGAGDDDEQLGDCVRDALGEDALAVEEVSVLTDTPYDDLPPSAVQRMGMTQGQRNLLLRVVIRQAPRADPRRRGREQDSRPHLRGRASRNIQGVGNVTRLVRGGRWWSGSLDRPTRASPEDPADRSRTPPERLTPAAPDRRL
jgi:phenylalanyl-tRNA synthetase alpha chain